MAIFSSILGSNTSIVVNSNLPWWFRSVWAVHNNLHLPDPIKCRAEALNHWCWFMAGLTPQSSMLRVIVVYPLFITGHDTMKKPFFFYLGSSCSYMTRCHLTSLDFNSYNTQSHYFWIIPNAFKNVETNYCVINF